MNEQEALGQDGYTQVTQEFRSSSFTKQPPNPLREPAAPFALGLQALDRSVSATAPKTTHK